MFQSIERYMRLAGMLQSIVAAVVACVFAVGIGKLVIWLLL